MMPLHRHCLLDIAIAATLTLSACAPVQTAPTKTVPGIPLPPLGVTIPAPLLTEPERSSKPQSKPVQLPHTPTGDTPNLALPTPLPTRARWEFGELLPYTTQSGDTLEAIAARFNQTPDALLAANPSLTTYTSTLPPHRQLVIPARYAPHLGSPFKIIPDSELVYGPEQATLDLQAIIKEHGGWLATRFGSDEGPRYKSWDPRLPSWEIVEQVALNYSVNPRLLLALLEHRSGILAGPAVDETVPQDPLRLQNTFYNGVWNQLSWAASILNAGYYGWRSGTLIEVEFADGRVHRIDPWQNAGTVALHKLFSEFYGSEEFEQSVGPEGFVATYRELFGAPFALEVALIPANLKQPSLELPFHPGVTWSFTGGPHAAWGSSLPWAALDFAPPAAAGGCGNSNELVTAIAPGIVARVEHATAVLDLDGDGNENTGWSILYFHLLSDSIAPLGQVVDTGYPIGHASCEGGRVTGTHVHIARKYNGEWIAADGPIPFEMSGWIAHAGSEPYKGRLTYDLPAQEIRPCECVSHQNMISR